MTQPSGTMQVGEAGYVLDDFDKSENDYGRAFIYASHRQVEGMREAHDKPGTDLRHRFDVSVEKSGATQVAPYHVVWSVDSQATPVVSYTANIGTGDWQDEAVDQEFLTNGGDPFDAFDLNDPGDPLAFHTVRCAAYGDETNRNSETGTMLGTYVEQRSSESFAQKAQLADHSAGDELYGPYHFVSAWHLKYLYARTYNKFCHEARAAYSVPCHSASSPLVGS